jgi:hypothetical protein
LRAKEISAPHYFWQMLSASCPLAWPTGERSLATLTVMFNHHRLLCQAQQAIPAAAAKTTPRSG